MFLFLLLALLSILFVIILNLYFFILKMSSNQQKPRGRGRGYGRARGQGNGAQQQQGFGQQSFRGDRQQRPEAPLAQNLARFPSRVSPQQPVVNPQNSASSAWSRAPPQQQSSQSAGAGSSRQDLKPRSATEKTVLQGLFFY